MIKIRELQKRITICQEHEKKIFSLVSAILLFNLVCQAQTQQRATGNHTGKVRERININEDWRFFRYETNPDSLIYDERPSIFDKNDDKAADTRATLENYGKTSAKALKAWILPIANEFIKDETQHYKRPADSPGKDFAFVKNDFDDFKWENIDLPHDWAIDKPFYTEEQAIIGGGMGRLPIQGVAWYRRKIDIPTTDSGKEIHLDIDGAMSYAMVWLNGNLVGGWPFGNPLG